jgi:hypothetical protein
LSFFGPFEDVAYKRRGSGDPLFFVAGGIADPKLTSPGALATSCSCSSLLGRHNSSLGNRRLLFNILMYISFLIKYSLIKLTISVDGISTIFTILLPARGRATREWIR